MKTSRIIGIAILGCMGIGILVGIPLYKKSKDEEWVRVQAMKVEFNKKDRDKTKDKIFEKYKEMSQVLDDYVTIQDNMKYVFEHGGEDDKNVLGQSRAKIMTGLKRDWESYPYYNTPFPKYTVDELGFVDLDSFSKEFHKGMLEEIEKVNQECEERLKRIEAQKQPNVFIFF